MAKGTRRSESKATHEQIARRAYEIFMERGRPAGRELEHWLEAETQLAGRRQPASRASAVAQAAPTSRRLPNYRA